MKFGDGGGDGAGFAENGDFEEAGVNGAGEIGDLFELQIAISTDLDELHELKHVREVYVQDHSSAVFHPVFSPAAFAPHQYVDCTHRCTFACRACNRTRSRICSCLRRLRILFLGARCVLLGKGRDLVWYL